MTDTTSTQVTGAELRQFIERVERLETQKQEIAEDIKDVFAEAKSRGYDTKIMKTVIRLRKKDPNERAEEEALLDAYMRSLGMQPDLFKEAAE